MTTDHAIAILSEESDDGIESYVADLPAETVPQLLAKVMGWARQFRQAQKMLERRMITEAVVGEVFTTDNGDWRWVGDRKRVCSDPDELRSLLLEQSREWSSDLAKRALLRAFKTEIAARVLELDEVVRWEPSAAALIREYVSWTETPPHLRRMDEE